MMTAVPIYFSFDLTLPEIVLAGIAWLMLLLALWPLMFLLRPRRRQKKITEEISAPEGGWPGISVVVYCRDEATSLEQLLEKLFAQEYDGEYEIIISSDGRNEDIDGVVKRLMSKFNRMRVTFVPDEARSLSRRKMAFTLGIKAAQHDI
ncbi:MAG: glycosyltransferase, partial [Muribaculaceae bacterium]|nr:glycosyltransferase [Muribaculaceae bacterium]